MSPARVARKVEPRRAARWPPSAWMCLADGGPCEHANARGLLGEEGDRHDLTVLTYVGERAFDTVRVGGPEHLEGFAGVERVVRDMERGRPGRLRTPGVDDGAADGGVGNDTQRLPGTTARRQRE